MKKKPVTQEIFVNYIVEDFQKGVKEQEAKVANYTTEQREHWIKREWTFFKMNAFRMYSNLPLEWHKALPKTPPAN